MILAEFYDNGFNVTDTNLLQSAAKTYAAILVHQLVDSGKIKLDAKVELERAPAPRSANAGAR